MLLLGFTLWLSYLSTPEIIEKAGVVVVHTTDEQEEEDATIVKTIEVNNEMEEYSVQELTKMLEEAIQNEEYEKPQRYGIC